jgi:hypothetical protein
LGKVISALAEVVSFTLYYKRKFAQQIYLMMFYAYLMRLPYFGLLCNLTFSDKKLGVTQFDFVPKVKSKHM